MTEFKGIFVSDVCGTLFYENTTLGFVKFHLKNFSKKRFLFFFIMTSEYLPLIWFFKILEYFSKKNLLFKKMIVLFLKGEDKENIQRSAELYTNYLFQEKKIQKVWDYLFKYKNKNFRIILASSSIEPVIKEIAKKIKAEYFSSYLEIKDSKYTGIISIDTLYSKIKYLDKLGIDIKKINLIISDNYEDLDLIKNAQKGIAICNSFKKSIFWKKNKINRLLWV